VAAIEPCPVLLSRSTTVLSIHDEFWCIPVAKNVLTNSQYAFKLISREPKYVQRLQSYDELDAHDEQLAASNARKGISRCCPRRTRSHRSCPTKRLNALAFPMG